MADNDQDPKPFGDPQVADRQTSPEGPGDKKGPKNTNPPIVSWAGNERPSSYGQVIAPSHIDLNEGGTSLKADTEYNDPLFSGGDLNLTPAGKSGIMESALDSVQSRGAKLGNGLVKFAGSFADGVLSVPGTIWGLGLAATGHGIDKVWDNFFTKAGQGLQDTIDKNFINYRSVGEQTADAWKPQNWMTMNFLADNVIGNLGFAASAWATGSVVGDVLANMAPWIAGSNVAEAIDIMKETKSLTALKEFPQLAKALNRWNLVQQGVSQGIAAASEASTEAYNGYSQIKNMIMDELKQKYGGDESKISQKEKDQAEEDAKHSGNLIYGLNIPILTAANIFMFGKSFTKYKSELNTAVHHKIDFAEPEGLLGGYAAKGTTPGFKAGLARGISSLAKGFADNLVEAGQEGAQYIISQGPQNYYARKYDPNGQEGADSMFDSYISAANTLFTTQSGFANMMGGFLTPVFMPPHWKKLLHQVSGKENRETSDYQLSLLNSIDAKDTIKRGYEAMIRHVSIQNNLDAAIKTGSEYEARNLQNDLMKNYIQSRIEAGRFDLLKSELHQMSAMDGANFKQFLGLDPEQEVDHKKMLNDYADKAKDMQRTYSVLDRVFQPALYKLPVDREARMAAIQNMQAYKEMAWSHMMDAKDSDQRLQGLRKEVDEGLGGIVSLNNILGEKTKDRTLNSWINEYNTTAIEHAVKKQADPNYENQEEARTNEAVLEKLKARVIDYAESHRGAVGLPEAMEKGNKHYMEEYLLDIEKQLDKLNENAVFNKTLLGGQGAVVDVHELTGKLNDLRRLEQRRMLAIQAYNNLSSIIRTGKYMDVKVKNPYYDHTKHAGQQETITRDGQQVANPDYEPEYVTNDKLLRDDTYARFADERDKYRRDRDAKRQENLKQGKEFTDKLDKNLTLAPDNNTPEGTKYKDAYAKHLYGTPQTQGTKNMTHDEFYKAHSALQQQVETHSLKGTFATDTPKARKNFDQGKYIDLKAKMKAHEDTITERLAASRKEAEAQGLDFAKQYNHVFNEQGKEAAENFYQGHLEDLKRKGYDSEAIKVLTEHVDGMRKDMGVTDQEVAPPPETQTGEKVEQQADLKEPVLPPAPELQAAGTQVKEPVVQLEPSELTSREGEVAIEKMSNLMNKPVAETYLTPRRRDLEWGINRYKVLKTYKLLAVGDQIKITGVDEPLKIIAKTDASITVKGEKMEHTYKAGEFETLMNLSQVQRGYSGPIYDEHGLVKPQRYFRSEINDPRSSLYLSEGKAIRVIKVAMKDGFPVVKISVNNGGTLTDTGIQYSTNPDAKGIISQFGHDVDPRVISAIQQELIALNEELTSKGYVDAVITNQQTGFGKFIFNEGEPGSRQAFGLNKAFDIKTINKRDDKGGIMLGFIRSNITSGASIAQNAGNNKFYSISTNGIYIPQSSIDALTSFTKTGKAGKAGQYVAVLPTGRTFQQEKVSLPVLLNTRNLNADVSDKHTRADGTPMSVGEATVDVLLNPGDPKNRQALSSLFDFVGLPFDAASPNYEALYTNDNVHKIIDSLFFASGKSVKDENYTKPFSIYAETAEGLSGEGRSTKLTIDITANRGSALQRTQARADIYITQKDGSLNQRTVDERIQSYLTSSKNEKLNKELSYEMIQDAIRDKPYRVDSEKASLPAEKTPGHKAIVFDKEGNLTTQVYDSYLHYLDDKNILTSTVQGMQQGDRRVYMVNTPIAFNRITAKVQEEIPKTISTAKDAVAEARNEGTEPTIDELFGKVKEPPVIVTAKLGGPAEDPTISTLKNFMAAGITTNAKGDVVKPTGQVPQKAEGIEGLRTGFGTKLKDFGAQDKTKKGLIDPTQVRSVNQFTIEGYDAHVGVVSSEVSKELLSMILESYNRNQSQSFNRDNLKRSLVNRLVNNRDYLIRQQQAIYEEQGKKGIPMAMTLGDNIDAINFALQYFDANDFDYLEALGKRTAEQHKDLVSQVDESGTRRYFVGFYNLALNELFKSKIVDVHSASRELLEFKDEGGLDYTKRFDDSWSFKVDPRETLGKYSRIVLSTIPEYHFNSEGNLEKSVGPLGSQNFISYEAAFKSLIQQTKEMPEDQFYNFINSIPTEDATKNSPVLRAVYERLNGINQDYGNDNYIQTMRQLGNALMLQHASYKRFDMQVEPGKGATFKIYDADRQMINDELVSIWSKNMNDLIGRGSYVQNYRTSDPELGTNVTTYQMKLHEYNGNRYDLPGLVRAKLQDAFDAPVVERYEAVAKVFVNDMGFPLTGDGTIAGTAAVLKSWDQPRKGKNSNTKVFQQYFNNIREYSSLHEMVADTLSNYIAQPMKDAVGAGTFNIEQPLAGSTTVLNTYAKALKGNFKDVVNANVSDITGATRYIYVPRNNLAQIANLMKSPEYLWGIATSSYGQYMPGVSDVFEKGDNGQFLGKDKINQAALARMEHMDMDYLDGIKRNNYLTQEAKGAKAGGWDLLSLTAFQNDEEYKNKTGRGDAFYSLVFGDTSVAPYYRAEKYIVQADITSNESGEHIALKGPTREMLYGIFKSEVNRSVQAATKFSAIQGDNRIEQIKQQLKPTLHYILRNEGTQGETAFMGSYVGVYNFGEDIFNHMMSEQSPLFTTTAMGKDRFVTGIRKEVISGSGLNEAYLRKAFDSIIDPFVNNLVTAKMKQLEPFIANMIRYKTEENELGQTMVNSAKMELFSAKYTKSMESITGTNITYNGEPLANTHRREWTRAEDEQRIGFKDMEDVKNNSYGARLFKAMILDQQVNTAIFKAKWSAINMADPAMYQKEGRTDYKSFMDNYDKRMRGLVTPKMTTVQTPGDKVRLIAYQDPKMSDTKRTFSAEEQKQFNSTQQRVLDFIQEHMKEHYSMDKEGNLTLPHRIIGHQVEAMLALNEDSWGPKGSKESREMIANQMKEYLNAKVMDGATFITLREYLKRFQREGKIKDDQEFQRLYDILKQKDLKLSDEDYKTQIPLQALKYVLSGSKIDAGELQRVYKKDAEFVLYPALTVGTKWDAIREHMESFEQPDHQNGIILAPMSAMKMGAMAPVTLFDEKGNYNDAIKNEAVVDEWPMEALGKQIQNPDKMDNRTTASIQADKYIHANLPAGTKVATDQFHFPIKGKEAVSEQDIQQAIDKGDMKGAAALKSKQIEGLSKRKEFRDGVFNNEMMQMKFRSKSEQMRRDLNKLMNTWGLKYEAGGDDYKKAMRGLGLQESASLKELQEKMDDKDPNIQRQAYTAYKLRNQVQIEYIDKLLNSVREDVMQRKGLTINNVYDLKVAEDNPMLLDMPLTFSPVGGQIQSAMLSKINNIINGRKLSGFGFAQAPSYGFGPSAAEGSTGLKGYTARYNESGEFEGVNAAEIAIPWRFTDAFGKLLDYDKYVNSDGTPKEDMFDKSMLKIVGIRIPNTGHNTMGSFQVAKFLRGYKDVAQVAPEVSAQMNSDFDYDKLITYIYQHEVGQDGKITKTQGYLHHFQDGAKAFMQSHEAKMAAARYLMQRDEPELTHKANNINDAIDAKLTYYAADILSEKNYGVEDQDDKTTMEDLLNLDTSEKLDLLKGYLDAKVYAQSKQDIADVDQKLAAKAAAFQMEDFSNIPNALNILQSDQQLNNAQIDSYHMMLGNEEVQRKMLQPLTTNWIKSEVDSKTYQLPDGTYTSLKEMRQGTGFKSPVAETTASNTRTSNAGADEMIGILANGKTTLFYGQMADLALSNQGPIIFFGDRNGNAVQEETYDRNRFVGTSKAYEALKGNKDRMTHPVYGNIPYKLNRLMSRMAEGHQVPTSQVQDSKLQASLDNANDPIMGMAGLSKDVANEDLLMTGLGYGGHNIPFLNQPSIRDYVKAIQAIGGVTSDNLDRSKAMNELLDHYVSMAGLDLEGATLELQAQSDGEITTRQILEHMLSQDDMKPLTVAELRDMIVQDHLGGELPQSFYARQLDALVMFLRIKDRANDLLTMQRGLSVESQGFTDTSIVGVDDQLNRFNKVGTIRGILNVDKLTDPRGEQFNTVLAKRYGLDTVRSMFRYGQQGMFSELGHGFTNARAAVLTLNRKGDDLATKKKASTAFTQFLLSDPTLYGSLVREVMGEGSFDASAIREKMMKEQYSIVKEGEKQRYNTLNNSNETTAGLLNRMQGLKDGDGTPYTQRYEILANLRAIQQRNNDNPSVVVYSNANNYKQRLDVLMAKSLVQMLGDSNADIQKLAKQLILYPYMIGGTNNPISYINHVPREILFKYGLGTSVRDRIAQVDNALFELNKENSQADIPDTDRRSAMEQILSGDYIKKNMQSLNMLRNFAIQYYQHAPYEVKTTVEPSDIKKRVSEDGITSYDIASHQYIVKSVDSKNKAGIYVRNDDGSYSKLDPLSRKFNVSQYTYNMHSQGESRSLSDNDGKADGINRPLNGVMEPQENVLTALPYKTGLSKSITNEKLNGTVAPLREGLKWISDNSSHMMAEQGQSPEQTRVHNQYKALADFLTAHVPDIKYKINTDAKINNIGATALTNFDALGNPVSIEYNPNSIHKGASELFHFKTALLHESAHALTAKTIEVLDRMEAGEIQAKDAAQLLNVKVTDLKMQRYGYDRLKSMLNDKDVKAKIRKALIDTYAKAYTKENGEFNRTAMESAVRNAEYALSDMHEFISFAMSDRAFRKVLNDIDYKMAGQKRTLLQRITDLFREILGIRKGSALEEAFHDIMALTEPMTTIKATLGEDKQSIESKKALFTVENLGLPFTGNQDTISEITDRYNFKQENC